MNRHLQFEGARQPPQDGYTDEQLLALSRLHSKTEAGLVPWASWELENSAFGKTFRYWTGFPRWLPLCATSDHGVHWESRCWPNEVESRYGTFFTWNGKKARLMREGHGKNAFHVPHPWLSYRRAFYSEPPANRFGTLVFFAHSNRTTTPVYHALDAYMADLRALPAKFKPVVICLSFHDVQKGIHKLLRKYGMPLVTAGTTNSQQFVDRFYRLTRQFRYSTSANVGSHTFYLIEAGVPFFLFGQSPEYHIKGSNAVKDGIQNLADYGDEEDIAKLMHFRQILADPVEEVTESQRAVALHYLGADASTTPDTAARELWKALLKGVPALAATYAAKGHRLLHRPGAPSPSRES